MRRLALSGFLLLAACTTDGGDGPRRPPVEMPAPLAVVDPALVVGTWQCRDLNPYPGQPEQTVTSTYDADGSFTDRSRVAGPPPAGGAIDVVARGRWAVEGGRIVTREVRTEAHAAGGDPKLDEIAALSAEFLNSRPRHERDGAVDVLRLSPDELVLRPAEVEDPAIVRCLR
ncbi:hypothetical protein [Benzoatithermus flavus]|uniref:Lipoprotein n=1 Tax=Benzoatithermus flavus TaxID=3108223 RepID=A0ABU8XQB4_9PROT